MKYIATPQAALLQIVVYLVLVARLPQLHELVHLVDQRHRLAIGRLHAEVTMFALIPGFELDLPAAAATLVRSVFIRNVVCLIARLFICRRAFTARKNLILVGKQPLGQAARDGIENAGSSRSIL